MREDRFLFARITKRQRITLLVLGVIGIAILGYWASPLIAQATSFSSDDLERVKQFIQSFGILGPLVVILLMVLKTALPPVPIPVFLILIANALVFGFWAGLFTAWIAHIAAALYAFYFSRILGEHRVRRLLRNRGWEHYDLLLGKRGPYIVFVMRLLMITPFNIISYLSGLTPMSPLAYTIATALGVIPEVVLLTYLGERLEEFEINLFYFLEIVTVLGVLGLVGSWLGVKLWTRFLKSKNASTNHRES